jgi:fumarate reductase subunit D
MPATLYSVIRDRPAGALAGFGFLSGALSAAWGHSLEIEALRPLALVFGLTPGALPIGVFYGVALGLGVAAWARKPWAALVILVVTLYAWSAAIHTAIRLQRNAGDDPHLIAASLCAGAVGAGLTHLGCAPFAGGLRQPRRIAASCVVGAVAGLLFFFGERKLVDERLLYLVWQPAVAFVIGLGLREPVQQA